MKTKMLYGKKAQIFELLIVLGLFVVCGYALFKFITTSGGFEGILISPSSVLKLHSNSEKFELFAGEASRQAVIQSYHDIAKEGDYAGDDCLQADYLEFCGLYPDLDGRFSSEIRKNLLTFLQEYGPDEFGNSFAEISYEPEVKSDMVKITSQEKVLHMPVQEGNFPYSARYDFNHEISLSLDELGLTAFSLIYDRFLFCNEKESVEEIETCIQELGNFDLIVRKEGEKNLFDLTTKKKFFFESDGKFVYEPIEIKFSS